MMKFCFLLIPILGLYSFKTISHPESDLRHISSYHQKDTSQYAIINYDKSNPRIFENAKPTILTNDDIKLLEEILRKAIENHNKETKSSAFAIKPLERYKKQLLPVINSKGEKEVWVNCLCDVHGDSWRTQIIFVDDGGNCYFNLKINLATKTFYDIQVNGYA